jgi:predicted component of type VI protein secretion system
VSGILQLADGRSVPVVDGLVLGRAPGVGLTLDDEKASRRHAKLAVQLGVVELEDLGSRNGTLLNGSRVEKRMLRDGDEITIGTTQIRYVATASAAVPPAPAKFAGPAPGEDLFGDEAADEVPAAQPPRVAPQVAPRPSPPPSSPVNGPASPPKVDVLEFVDDEIVEVRAAAPNASASSKPTAAGPTVSPSNTARDRAGEHRVGGVLQFQAKPRKTGLLAGDVSQLGGAARAGIVLLALAVAGGLAWAALTLFG